MSNFHGVILPLNQFDNGVENCLTRGLDFLHCAPRSELQDIMHDPGSSLPRTVLLKGVYQLRIIQCVGDCGNGVHKHFPNLWVVVMQRVRILYCGWGKIAIIQKKWTREPRTWDLSSISASGSNISWVILSGDVMPLGRTGRLLNSLDPVWDIDMKSSSIISYVTKHRFGVSPVEDLQVHVFQFLLYKVSQLDCQNCCLEF